MIKKVKKFLSFDAAIESANIALMKDDLSMRLFR